MGLEHRAACDIHNCRTTVLVPYRLEGFLPAGWIRVESYGTEWMYCSPECLHAGTDIYRAAVARLNVEADRTKMSILQRDELITEHVVEEMLDVAEERSAPADAKAKAGL